MALAQVNGINMYYEVHGSGQPLTLIMGLRRNAEWWYGQIPELSQHFQVIAFDNRGAGRTDKPAMDYSIRMFADDTAGLLDHLGIDNSHVLGISMGGYIAQELAINHPRKVRSIVLGCTGGGGARAVMMTPERLEKFRANEGLTPRQILEKDMYIYFSDEFRAQNPDLIERHIEKSLLHYQPPEAFERQYLACRAHDTLDRLHLIRAPVLIATGDDDPLVPPENSYILKELMPQARLEVFPKGRHIFFIEFAEEFNRMAIEFFQAVEKGAPAN